MVLNQTQNISNFINFMYEIVKYQNNQKRHKNTPKMSKGCLHILYAHGAVRENKHHNYYNFEMNFVQQLCRSLIKNYSVMM